MVSKRQFTSNPTTPNYWYRFGHFQQFNMEEPDSSLAEFYFRKAIALNPLSTPMPGSILAPVMNWRENSRPRVRPSCRPSSVIRHRRKWPGATEIFLLRNGDLPNAYAKFDVQSKLDPHRAATAFLALLSWQSRYRRDSEDKSCPREPSRVCRRARRSRSLEATCRGADVWERLATDASAPGNSGTSIRFVFGAFGSRDRRPNARRVWDEGVATMTLPQLLSRQRIRWSGTRVLSRGP